MRPLRGLYPAHNALAEAYPQLQAADPLTPGFELKPGTLVVYTMRELRDSGNLIFDATRHVATRVLRELTEGEQGKARARPSRALAR